MQQLHLLCAGRHVQKFRDGTIEVGHWPIHPRDAEQMIGGVIFLHKSKALSAYDAGEVVWAGVAPQGERHPGHVVFRYRPLKHLRGAAWDGTSGRGMAADPRPSLPAA